MCGLFVAIVDIFVVHGCICFWIGEKTNAVVYVFVVATADIRMVVRE